MMENIYYLSKGVYFSPNSISRNANINIYVALPIILEDRFIGMVWVNRTPVDIVKVLYGKRLELSLATIFILCMTFFLAFFLRTGQKVRVTSRRYVALSPISDTKTNIFVSVRTDFTALDFS